MLNHKRITRYLSFTLFIALGLIACNSKPIVKEKISNDSINTTISTSKTDYITNKSVDGVMIGERITDFISVARQRYIRTSGYAYLILCRMVRAGCWGLSAAGKFSIRLKIQLMPLCLFRNLFSRTNIGNFSNSLKDGSQSRIAVRKECKKVGLEIISYADRWFPPTYAEKGLF
jgi:hypothetical protein